MNLKQLLAELVNRNASDLFLRTAGFPSLRIDGKIAPIPGTDPLTLEEINKIVDELTPPRYKEILKTNLDTDFAIFSENSDNRFRISVFFQRNSPSIVIRNVHDGTINFEQLNLPAEIMQKLSMESRGLVLLTGATGSGKSTTIASMIEYINTNSHKHILTIEEPIEFTFKDKNSVINQRELGVDVPSYSRALRAFALQSPDVIYIGNIRDFETMSAALTAAETGVLVLSTLHTINATQTVERIINLFPQHQHQQIRMQLAYLLKGVISLRLPPLKNQTGRIPAYEVMVLTPTIARLIREGKTNEMQQYIEDGSIFGMQSFNQSLVKLVKDNKISEEEAVIFSDSKDEFMLALKGFKKA